MTMWLVLWMVVSCVIARPQVEQWQPLPVLSSPPEKPSKSSSSYTERVIASLHSRHKLKHPGVVVQPAGELEKKKVTSEDHASESLDALIHQHAAVDNGGGTVGFIKQPVNVEDVRWEHVNHDHEHASENWDHGSSHHHHNTNHDHESWNHDHHDHYHQPPSVILVEDVKPPYLYNKPTQDTSHWSNYDHPRPTYENYKPELTTQYYTLLTVKPLEHTSTVPPPTKPYPQIVIINHYPTNKPFTTTNRPYYPTYTYPSTYPADFTPTTPATTATTTRRPTTTTRRPTTTPRPTTPRPTTPLPTRPTVTFWPYYTTTPLPIEPNRCGNINISSTINNYVGNSSKQALTSCPDINILITNFNQNVKDVSTTTFRPLGDDPVDEEDVGEEVDNGSDVDVGGSGEGGGGGINPMVPIFNFLVGLNPLTYGFWSLMWAPVALFMGMMALFTPYALWKRSYHSHPVKSVAYHKHNYKMETFHDHNTNGHHESKGYHEHEYSPYYSHHHETKPSYYRRRKVKRRSVFLDEAAEAVTKAIEAVQERLTDISRRNSEN